MKVIRRNIFNGIRFDQSPIPIFLPNCNKIGASIARSTICFLLHFAGKSAMLDTFDEELFEQAVDRIIVQSRSEFVFGLKCV